MLAVTVFSSFLALYFFHKLISEFTNNTNALFLTTVFSIFPARWLIVRSIGSPEPLFIAAIIASIYYFDKKNHLVAKIEMRATDQATKQEVNQEKFIVDYQDKGGLKVAKHIIIHNDGNPFMDIEITEIQVHEKLDDSLFARP